jgi:short-subunit dehydrogenase
MIDEEKIDILINNAGVAHNDKFETVKKDTFDKIMKINVQVLYFLTQKALPYLRKSNSATIINIASVVAHAGYENQSVYTMSKHALLGFTKSLAVELYKENIRVHAISPGGVYTDMIKVSRPDLSSEGMIMPKDIVDIIVFILTHRGNAVIDEILVHRVGKQPFLV